MSRTIGELADALFTAREVIRGLEEQVKEARERYALVEEELFAAAEAQKTLTGKGSKAAFSIGESVVPQVVDWDAFYKFIAKNKYYHLLERRPSVTGCRELFETKGAIPGVESARST
jgi:hypothetical protein